MRIAVLSDIHANRHALDATLADLQAERPEQVYCLGDLVGYAAFPNEVTERIRSEGFPTVMGNYDDGVGFDRAECGCAYKAPLERELGQQSLEWTKAHTAGGTRRFFERSCRRSVWRATAGASSSFTEARAR